MALTKTDENFIRSITKTKLKVTYCQLLFADCRLPIADR